jgi:DNA helicase-2/ATP-dependent DNA helicase PcrA
MDGSHDIGAEPHPHGHQSFAAPDRAALHIPGGFADRQDRSRAHILGGLTEPQREAVLAVDGPVLVLAAAGSGKTRVITRRIAYLLGLGASPWSVLALTFTNKASGEMRERVSHLMGELGGPEPRGLTVTTFHALCARLLRKYAEQAGLPGLKPDFVIYDAGDQSTAMKATLAELQLSTTNWPPRSVLSAISNAKNDLLDAQAFAQQARDYYATNLAKIYAAYERRLRQAGAVDFDDLLLLTAAMLRTRAEIRAELQHRYRYLLIDEYQDTNRAQFEIARMLAGQGEPNIFVVGDPDQAIYGWRGADISNILDFEQHYPSARVIRLGENFRSTTPILASADMLIKKNQRRKDKPLFTTKEGGEPVRVVLCRSGEHEASVIADDFSRLHAEEGLAWKDMAVLYRTNALSRVMEDALRQAQVPYVIARGTAFFEREEVRDALAYLRLVANPADDVSLERVINKPARGIGKTTLDKLRATAEEHRVPVLDVVRGVPREELGRSGAALDRFLEVLDGWTGAGTFLGAQVASSLHDLVERVIRESGLDAHYAKQAKASGSEADEERIENLSELISSARAFEDEYDPSGDPFAGVPAATSGAEAPAPPLLAMLRAYLESVALVADADKVDPSQGAVTLMTLHAAKGLEFSAVAMIGLEEGLLPHSRAFESEADLEEERRLCFVGMTRAMHRLQLSCAKYRTLRGVPERTIPSRFLGELPREHARVSDQSEAFDDFEGAGGAGAMGRGFTSKGLEDRLEQVRTQRLELAGAGDRARSEYPPGCTVRHPQFGEGVVVSVKGGQNPRAEIKFKGAGVKTLVLEYARLVRVR